MSETIANKLVQIAENEVKLYEKTFGRGYRQGKTDGYDEAMSERKTEVSKSVTITENGTRTITPNSRETFSSVEVTVDVRDTNGSYNEGYNQGLIDGKKTEIKGEYEVTKNGEYTYTPDGDEVFESVKVNVNVPIPDGYIQPAGTMDITKNGEYNIAEFEKVNVNVEGSGGSGGNNNLMEYFEGKTTDLYWDDVKKLIGSAFAKQPMTSARFLALTEVGGSAFEQCSELVSIDMPEVTIILPSAFYSCGSLALTELPPKLSRIVTSAFENCTSLAITHIPASVVAIAGNAFKNCSGLTSITFKGKPNSIAATAFSGCTNLTTINVPWAENAVKNAPWGAPSNVEINYKGE